jgi:hypothetical protein
MTNDVTLTLPVEHFSSLSAVISAGLKHAAIKAEDRKELQSWWAAESELVQDAIEDSKDR